MEAGIQPGSPDGELPFAAREAYARITTQSRRQAMDWSLVLASQDIHPIIEEPESRVEPARAAEEIRDSTSWSLLVEPGQYERAMAAIRQYRLENRGWAWRRELPGAAVEIHTGAVFWCLFLIAWHWVTSFVAPGWVSRGEMFSVGVRAGEWYRLFTAVLLHSDLAHLMANATFGAIFLGLAMARFGWGVTLLATFLAGGAGNLLGFFAYEGPYRGRGASGMMMGALGLLCIQSFGLWRKSPKAARYILSGVLAGFLLFVLFGLDPGSDILAHFGGFVAGLFFGAVLSFLPEQTLQTTRTNFAALAVVAIIIAVTWGLALR